MCGHLQAKLGNLHHRLACARCSLFATHCPFTCLLDLDTQRTTWWFTHKLAAYLYPSDDGEDDVSFTSNFKFNFKSAFTFKFNFKSTGEDDATLRLPSSLPTRAINASAEGSEWVPSEDPFVAIILVRI